MNVTSITKVHVTCYVSHAYVDNTLLFNNAYVDNTLLLNNPS